MTKASGVVIILLLVYLPSVGSTGLRPVGAAAAPGLAGRNLPSDSLSWFVASPAPRLSGLSGLDERWGPVASALRLPVPSRLARWPSRAPPAD